MVAEKNKPGYPDYVCHTCGMDYGYWYKNGVYVGPPHWCSTMHIGKCGLCGASDVTVTEPRDYGHLCKEWQEVYYKRKSTIEDNK